MQVFEKPNSLNMYKKTYKYFAENKLRETVENRQEKEVKTLLSIIKTYPKSELMREYGIRPRMLLRLEDEVRTTSLSHIEYLTLVMIANLVSQKK